MRVTKRIALLLKELVLLRVSRRPSSYEWHVISVGIAARAYKLNLEPKDFNCPEGKSALEAIIALPGNDMDPWSVESSISAGSCLSVSWQEVITALHTLNRF